MLRAVWSHNTIVYRATNFTPFQLLFRAEAMLAGTPKLVHCSGGTILP
jgi:hypothetical protein